MATPAVVTQPRETLPHLWCSRNNRGWHRLKMSGLHKAAILMLAVGDDLAKVLFKSLSKGRHVQQVTNEISALGECAAEQLLQVLTEFYGLLPDEAVYGAWRPEYAIRLLAEAFGPGEVPELPVEARTTCREQTRGDCPWCRRWIRSS